MMILSLSWKKYNEKGAIASMVSGFLGVPFFKFVAPKIAGIGPYMDQLSELAPSFVLALVVGVVVTHMTSSKAVLSDAEALLKKS
jgi:Na+/proline symporter